MNSKSISSIVAFIILTLFFPIFLSAQKLTKTQAIEYANKLSDVEILSQKGRDLLIQFIDEEKLNRKKRMDMMTNSISTTNDLSPAQILRFLADAFGTELLYRKPKIEEKIDYEKDALIVEDTESITIPKDMNSSMLPIFGHGFIHEKCSVSGKTFFTTFSKLKEIGLIDQEVYNETIEMVYEIKIPIESIAINYAKGRAIFHEDYEEEKAKEYEFIKNLHKHGLISDKNLKVLFKKEQEKHLRHKFELIKYCKNAKVFDIRNYSIDASQGYREIFEEIKTLLPDTDIEDFKAEIITKSDESKGLLEENLSISFDVKGNTYSCQSFYDSKKINQGTKEIEQDTVLQINDNFHKGINKYLADKNSDYRLYLINKYEVKLAFDNEFGVILMTEKQAAAWGEYTAYFFHHENHDNELNTKNIQAFIETCDSLGLFSHLSQEEIDEGFKCVKHLQNIYYRGVLQCFPKTIIIFNDETGDSETPYKELTLACVEASRGAFTPTNIVDTFEQSAEMGATFYGFDFKGKTYRTELPMKADWLYAGFIPLMEKAMIEHGVDGDFYDCGSPRLIFLSKAQHTYLKKHYPSLLLLDYSSLLRK